MTKIFKSRELNILHGQMKDLEETPTCAEKITKLKELLRKDCFLTSEEEKAMQQISPMPVLDPKTSKQDKLKVCSEALHPEFSYPLIEVAELSLEKGYAPLNWLAPDNKVTVTYLIAAAQRHLDLIKMGVDRNTEEKRLDGTPTTVQPWHAAQVAYNMLMLCRQMLEGVEIDDRLFRDGRLK